MSRDQKSANKRSLYNKIHDATSKRKICYTNIRNSSKTNLIACLRRKHPSYYDNDDAPKKPKISRNTFDGDDTPNAAQPTTSTSSSIKSFTDPSRNHLLKKKPPESSTPGTSTMKITDAFNPVKSFSDNDAATAKYTNALMYFVVKANLPLSITDNDGFKVYSKTLYPLYKPPSSSTLTRYIDDKYEVIKGLIVKELGEQTSMALTTNIWTNTFKSKSYLGVTVHYVNKEGDLKAYTLGTTELSQSHDHLYLGSSLKSVLEDWCIDDDDIITIITDNAPNIVKAVNETFTPRKHMPCFAHTLNLVANDALKKSPSLAGIVTKIKGIVTLFKQSNKAADELRKAQNEKGVKEGQMKSLIQNCETRWNSTFYMLQRFMELSDYVVSILRKSPNQAMLSHEEMHVVKDVILVLAPLEQATVEISSENYVSGSIIIPLTSILIKRIDLLSPDTTIGIALREYIASNLIKKFCSQNSNVEKNPTLAVATLVDPRFKKLHFQCAQAAEDAIKNVACLIKDDKSTYAEDELTLHSSSHKSNDLWEIHDQLAEQHSWRLTENEWGGLPTQLRVYLNEPVIPRKDDPLIYWKNRKTTYPKLYKIATKYLAVPGTSVPSERLFNLVGNTLTAKSSRLTEDRLSQLLFLNTLDKVYWDL